MYKYEDTKPRFECNIVIIPSPQGLNYSCHLHNPFAASWCLEWLFEDFWIKGVELLFALMDESQSL